MTEKYVGIITAGHIEEKIIRFFHQNNALYMICDLQGELQHLRTQIAPNVNYTSTPEKVLSDSRCIAVVIGGAVINSANLARRALIAGKDVFLENFLTLQMDAAVQIAEVAKQNNRILMAGKLLTHHPSILQLNHLLNTGYLGQILYFHCNHTSNNRYPLDTKTHSPSVGSIISMLMSIFGETPSSVSCYGQNFIDKSRYDVSLTHLTFPSGITGHVYSNWLNPLIKQGLVITGSKKIAVMGDLNTGELKIYPCSVKCKPTISVATKSKPEVLSSEVADPVLTDYIQFWNNITTGIPTDPNCSNALGVIKVIKSCEDSSHQEGRPQIIQSDPISQRNYSVHQSAYVDKPANIGQGTKIWHFSHVMKNAHIGQNCVIGQNVYIGSNAIIGNNVKIQNNVSVYDEVIIEDNVFCGPSMVFTNVFNPRSEIVRKHEYRKTLVMSGASLGANCTIVCGNTIGKYAFVAAGSVVNRDVPDFATVAGVPAIHIGWMCQCGSRLSFEQNESICGNCSQKYRKINTKKIELLQSEDPT